MPRTPVAVALGALGVAWAPACGGTSRAGDASDAARSGQDASVSGSGGSAGSERAVDAAADGAEASGPGLPPCAGRGDAAAEYVDGRWVTTLAAGQCSPSLVAVSGASVYWATAGSCAGDAGAAIVKTSLCGGSPTTLATEPAPAQAMVVTATSVYWIPQSADYYGFTGVVRVPVEGGTPTTLVANEQTYSLLALDAENLYWIESTASIDYPLYGHGGPLAIMAQPSPAASRSRWRPTQTWSGGSGQTARTCTGSTTSR